MKKESTKNMKSYIFIHIYLFIKEIVHRAILFIDSVNNLVRVGIFLDETTMTTTTKNRLCR